MIYSNGVISYSCWSSHGANDGLYDPLRRRQKEEDHTSSLTRFTYLDLIGFVVYFVFSRINDVIYFVLVECAINNIHESCMLSFSANQSISQLKIYFLYIWYRSLLNELFKEKKKNFIERYDPRYK